MFVLHSSNKTENLLAHLVAVMRNAPLSSPFAEEIFLIQSQGMERWLSQQLAGEFKVWGNYQYLFPGKFFSSLAERLDSRLSDAAFDRHLMLWRFEAALRDLSGDEFKPLQHYLAGENKDLKRFQLAQQLSQIFDQYQMMRPDMLEQWRQGALLYDNSSEIWQRALWRQVTTDTGQQHRGALWLQLVDKFNRADEGAFEDLLPERVSIFGVHSLPPLFLSFLQGLARHCDVHFYMLNPAQVYWGDVPGKKLRAQLESFDGHPLLAALGQQGREFQQMLLDQGQFELEFDSFEAHETDQDALNNLQRLQNDILANQQPNVSLTADASISLHACHSRMREVHVIKNQLLEALEQDDNLELRDIVVMAPDIQQYAPFISAVFGDIQHAIADRSLRLSNSALDVFLRLLHLSRSRFGWQTVLDLLEQPPVYTTFGLSTSDLELIRYWVDDNRVRWGKNGEHKQQLGLPALDANTWQAALERLLMGYAMADDSDFVAGVLPYRHIEGSAAQALGCLHDFLQLVFNAADEFKAPKTLTEWSEVLFRYADALLVQAETNEKQQLNILLLELGEHYASVHEQPLTLEVILAWLEGMVSEQKSSTGFLRGQLTFCSMLPMRSIPFKVIALLGMNDGEFPKVDRPPTFDLLGRNFRPGDRSRRADDRYQFLEILLSARQQLIISYIGRSIKRNDEIPPSIIISELLDVLKDHYQLDKLTTEHPLHAFSRRYFEAESNALFSYNPRDCETAKQLLLDRPSPSPWWQGSLDDELDEVIELSELNAFFRHPQRYFMQRQLGLRFAEIGAETEEREPFVVEGMENYSLQHEWIQAELNCEAFSLDKLQAQGRWPSGAPGRLIYAEQQPLIQEFSDRIREKDLGIAIPDQAIDLSIGNYRIVGKLSNLYQNGGLLYRYSALKGKDFFQTWLHHCLINQIQPQDTHVLSKSPDEDLLFPAALNQDVHLLTLIELFVQGRQRPDAFFIDAAFAYLQQATKAQNGRTKKTPLEHVLTTMSSKLEHAYEPELRRLFNNVEELEKLFNEAFAEFCETRLMPVWEAVYGQ